MAARRIAALLARGKDLVRRWGIKSGVSVLDQGLVAGSNFLLTLLLARWLSPAQYGAFAIAYSLYLFIAGFHNALILDPMYVLGASRHGGEMRTYTAALLWMHFALTAAAGLILAAAALIIRLRSPALGTSLLGLAISSPFMLLFLLLRAACYTVTRPARALPGSAIYAVIQLGAAYALYRSGRLSAFSAVCVLGLAGMGAGAALMISQGIGPRQMRWSALSSRIPGILRENWGYGKWIVGSAFVHWLSSAVYVPLIGTLAGADDAGAYQAMQNLLRPLQQSLAALNLLLLPFISRQRAAQGSSYLKKKIPVIAAVNVAASCVYFVVLLLVQSWVVKVLYRQSFYEGFTRILPWLCLSTLVSAFMQGPVIGLKGFERSDLLFWSQAAGAAFTITIGLFLVYTQKTVGAAIGSAIALALTAAASWLFLARLFRRKAP